MIKIEFGGKRCLSRWLRRSWHPVFRLPRFAPAVEARLRLLPDIRQILSANPIRDMVVDDGPAAISIPFPRLPENLCIVGGR
jgi:hypothetical protein